MGEGIEAHTLQDMPQDAPVIQATKYTGANPHQPCEVAQIVPRVIFD